MRHTVCLFLLVALLFGGCAKITPASLSLADASQVQSPLDAGASLQRLRCLFYEEETLRNAFANPCVYQTQGKLVAGVIPHHLVAADMIAGFFTLAATQKGNYDSLIIVSPSHYKENCGSEVVTATAEWDTPFGLVQPDTVIIQNLLANETAAAEDNPRAMEQDHGVAGLLPFAAQYLPGIKVSAVLLANGLSAARLDAVTEEVSRYCAQNRALLLISMDCSHYLLPQEAAKRDAETARAIEAFDLAAISHYTDSNVDSPEALTVFLQHTLHSEALLTQLDHASSADKLPHALDNPIYAEGITTYYVYAAMRPASDG